MTYNWRHVGHNPRSIDDIRNGPTQRSVIAFIQEQVDNSMTWYNIKNMLRLDKEALMGLLDEDNITAIPIGLSVKYSTVYYAMKKSMEKKARLHADINRSLACWEQKIIENESCRGFFIYRDISDVETGAFFISFMSSWQLKVYY